ncbi:MAG: RsmE family RNA methyltransferase [Acidobacteriota bacterium]
MTANQFYVPVIAAGPSRMVLRGGEHRHLAKAARVRAGEEIWLFDGRGRRCLARVEKVGEDSTEVAILWLEEPESPGPRLALAQCLIEARKLETVLEKAAEIGCSEFIPVTSARSYRPPGEREDRKLDRWRRIAREAAKQCKARLVTEVHAPRPLDRLLREPGADRKLFLSEHGGRPLKEILAAAPAAPDAERGAPAPAAGPPPSILLLVGPKGGWTEGEERKIREAGFEPASLGRRILRAETAAVAGAAMIAHFWTD